MPNKQLTAKVRLNTTSAEKSIDRLVTKINNIDRAFNKIGSNNKIDQQLKNNQTKLDTINSKVKNWANNQKQVNSHTRSTNNLLGAIGSKLKMIAATYLGIMGAKAAIKTSDTITSAENKLNYLSAQQLGDDGYNANGSYSQAVFQQTQRSMDKMYVSAQKVRMAYTDMLANVSKSMTLAGDAFQNSTDNAIRFQEIMSEAYTLGGASAAEMSSSMYQMIQALGSGTLAGDELRSVREGAPLAYKAIEEFAQGVLNSKESLKELASQGLITSDMVVAAIMNAGEQMDKAFKNTEMTFAQAWTNIKNIAIKSFEPVLQKLNDMLNSDIGAAMLNGITKAIQAIAKLVSLIFTLFEKFFTWFIDNWYWVQWIVYAVIAVIIFQLLRMAYTAIKTSAITFISFMVNNPWAFWILMIGSVIACIVYMANTAESVGEFIAQVAYDVAIAIIALLIGVAVIALTTGVMIMSIPMMIGLLVISVALIIIGAVAQVTQSFADACGIIVGYVYAAGSFIMNLVQAILALITMVAGAIAVTVANVVYFICNQAIGMWNAIQAICTNIRIAFENAWNGAREAFWNFVADVLSGLSFLEGPINAILSAFGKGTISISGLANTARSKASGYSQKSYVSVGNAYSSGANTYQYESYSGMASDVWSYFGNPFSNGWEDNAYNKGYNIGSKFGQNVTDKIGDLKNTLGFINDKLGVADVGNLPSLTDPANQVGGSYDPSKLGPSSNGGSSGGSGSKVKDIADDTSKIADSMDLAEEDLEYLRKIAAMEWKKEYTTNNIKIDMNNYNQVNGNSDLDGIVTKLVDKLYEELNTTASGVYA